MTLRPDHTGYHVGGLIREDHDVEVPIEVTEQVAATADRIASYLGKATAPADQCREIATQLREFLLVVAAAGVAERDARAFDSS